MHPFAYLLILALGPAAQPSVALEPWARMAETDLRFVHDTIADHHPGPVNEDDPTFREWHQQGLEASLALLDQVKSYGGYRAVLSRYLAGFRDGHLNVSLLLEYRWVGWPRFMLAWRDGKIRVHHVAEGLAAPARGAVLLECDGTPAETLFTERVLPFAGKGIPADRYQLVPEILIDRVNPLLDDLTRCVFEQGGEQVTVELDWQWQRWPSLSDIWQRATNGPRGEFAIREVPGNGSWISLPTFGPGGEDLERMKAIMAALPEQRKRDYVVVDVRGNGGGSSYWGEAIVRGLYGDAYYEAVRDAQQRADQDGESYAVHRVSAGNLEHFRGLLESIKAQAGEDSEFYRYFAALVVGMGEALEKGEELYEHHYEEEASDESAGASAEAAEPLYRGTVYYLTDGTCASACLDVADLLLELPGVEQVGQPTAADTMYMEVRNLPLPSRNGRLNFATKFYRNRKRGHNEWYSPEHEWTGDIWDTPRLERWILELRQKEEGAGGRPRAPSP